MKKEKLLRKTVQIGEKEKVITFAPIDLNKKKVKSKGLITFASYIILLICICLVFVFTGCDIDAGSVTIEINPSVEYRITKKGNVSSVRFLNDDAKKALNEVAFKGQSLKSAVVFTIATYKAIGYMDSNDMLLISFDKKLSENVKLKMSISDDLHQALAETQIIHTVVFALTVNDDQIAALAKEYNISLGKAKLIDDAIKNSNLPLEEVVKLPLDELVSLQKEVNSVVVNSKYIGMLNAKKIALKNAGCTTRVEFTETKLIDEGIKYPYYRLGFNDKNTQWTYIINAINGDIIERSKNLMFITLEEAKKIALIDAGITETEEVIFTKEELSRNQGQPCWILEFYTKKYQYSYKIDAKTGEILFRTRYISMSRAKEVALQDSNCQDIQKIVFTVEMLVAGGIKTPYYYFEFNDSYIQWTYKIDATDGGVMYSNKEIMIISLDKAKEIALIDAGITETEKVIFTKEELSRNQGQPCWILEFYMKKYQYSYKIDAKTGEILFSSCYIYIEIAQEIAIQDADIGSLEKIVFTSKELIDYGVKTPYYYFEFNNYYIQWTYHINSINGEIIFKEKTLISLNVEQ